MRCFIAIDINEQIRGQLADLQQQLEEQLDLKKGGVKWVRPALVHLTLKFLGEVQDEKIAQVCDIVDKTAAKHRGFELEVKEVGYFGKGAARVLWVGIGQASSELLSLQKDIEENLASAGWPKEARRFSGHLTLARIKNSQVGRRIAELAEGYSDLQLGSVQVDSVCVYQSQLRPTGPIYTLLANYKLK